MVRMALVPRVLEARGLDVTPGMMERLREVGDEQTIGILEIILRDEIGHVRIGSRWFRYCCEQRGLEPEATFPPVGARGVASAVTWAVLYRGTLTGWLQCCRTGTVAGNGKDWEMDDRLSDGITVAYLVASLSGYFLAELA